VGDKPSGKTEVNLKAIVGESGVVGKHLGDGFGGRVVCMLASETRVRGFNPGRSLKYAFLRRGSK
jgi:hypothetical protein